MPRPKGSKNKPKNQTMPTKTAAKTDMIDDAEVTQVETLPVVHQSTGITPMSMIDRAITAGASMEVLEKLMDLQERWEAKQARKAFDRAMADAKAEIPTITKNRAVDFTSQKGRTNYRYEDLESVASAVGPVLSKYGLSYRYRATSNVNEPVTVTCIISHRDGHFEELTLAAGRDDSGNKNSIQAISSTMTYLQRISLKAALGLAVSNDDDGQTSEEKPKDNGPPRQPAKPQSQSAHDPEEARDGTPPRRAGNAEQKPDPISSGPPRAVAKDTGPSAKPVEPFKLPGTGETFQSWAEKYIDNIKTSLDTATAYKWIDLNSDPLGRLNKGMPSIASQVKKATEQVMEKLRDAQKKAQEKTAKAAAKAATPPPSDMDAPAGDMDGGDAPVNPEEILAAIDRELAAVENPDDLQSVWETACEPLLAKLDFPPDQDLAQAAFDKHSRRLGGE
jgi:hypothetical protein